MSLQGLFVRFAVIYVGLLVAVSVVLALLGVKSSSVGSTGALLAAVMWACLWFARANKRYFTSVEKRTVFLGMLAIDVGLQALVSAAFIAAKTGGAPLVPMLAGVLIGGVLHAAVIWFFVGFSGRQYAKELAANGG